MENDEMSGTASAPYYYIQGKEITTNYMMSV